MKRKAGRGLRPRPGPRPAGPRPGMLPAGPRPGPGRCQRRCPAPAVAGGISLLRGSVLSREYFPFSFFFSHRVFICVPSCTNFIINCVKISCGIYLLSTINVIPVLSTVQVVPCNVMCVNLLSCYAPIALQSVEVELCMHSSTAYDSRQFCSC